MKPHFDYLPGLLEPNESKIILWILDGLGGLPERPGGPTELEAADTPHFDKLASEGITGLHVPVAPGVTPGSGPGHLGVFGYDPLTYRIGRGALAAAGMDFDLRPGDVAARGNFCTIDEQGRVTDRRAGRIDTETNQRLCERLGGIRLDGVNIFIQPIKEHRFLLVLRGEGLSDDLADTDPQKTGAPPREPKAGSQAAEKTAGAVSDFLRQARDILQPETPANMALLRGFAVKPDWPRFGNVFGLRAAAMAGYPMYRGVARLIGMDVLPQTETPEERVECIRRHMDAYDFFFLHTKITDSRGEDGDFGGKADMIARADDRVPSVLSLEPDVLIVTGDHSTPSILRSHSWHPVPTLLWSKTVRSDTVRHFGERACAQGGLGPRFPAVDLMPLALAHAGRLKKYGA